MTMAHFKKAVMYHVYFKYVFQYMIVEDNIDVFSFFFSLWQRIKLFLKCYYLVAKIEARCSYKMVLIKKRRVVDMSDV